MWAVEQMKQGKKVRRKDAWKNDEEVYIFENESEGTMEFNPIIGGDHINSAAFILEDFEATDWCIFEEEAFPIKYNMGLGYYLLMDKNGWIDYVNDITALTLVNRKEDLDILEKAISRARELQ